MQIKKITVNKYNPIFRLPKSVMDKWVARFSKNKVKIEVYIFLNEDDSITLRPKE